jgi:Starch-binding associating with outer membrane
MKFHILHTMNTHTTVSRILCLSGLLTCLACNDLDEVNLNPNGPTAELITPNLLLPAIERDFVNAYVDEAWVIGNTVMQYTAKTVTTTIDRYTWGDRTAIWDGAYDNLRELTFLLESPTVNDTYKGIALVFRAWMFSLLTDCHGDVPYSEAIKGKEGLVFPRYDRQEAIYQGLLADLALANSMFAKGTAVSGDIIYNGDPAKWRKLANSLRLRLLLRLSDRLAVATLMQEILSDPATYPIFTGNADNATYSYLDKAPDQFPLINRNVGSFNEWRAGKTLVDTLVSYNDPRLTVFFRPTPATERTPATTDDQYVGIPNGMSDGNANKYNGGPDHQSRINAFFYEGAGSVKGRQIAKGVIMTYAELQFILAEAAERNLVTGAGETYYTQGIEASFDFYGLALPASYPVQPNVQYGGSSVEKIRKIMTQKWISLFYQGFEAWSDWRRTGLPALSPGVDNQNNNKIPVRFVYPGSEYSLNKQQVEDAVKQQGIDDLNTRVWWDVR